MLGDMSRLYIWDGLHIAVARELCVHTGKCNLLYYPDFMLEVHMPRGCFGPYVV